MENGSEERRIVKLFLEWLDQNGFSVAEDSSVPGELFVGSGLSDDELIEYFVSRKFRRNGNIVVDWNPQ